jgi:hypothetical protein
MGPPDPQKDRPDTKNTQEVEESLHFSVRLLIGTFFNPERGAEEGKGEVGLTCTLGKEHLSIQVTQNQIRTHKSHRNCMQNKDHVIDAECQRPHFIVSRGKLGQEEVLLI